MLNLFLQPIERGSWKGEKGIRKAFPGGILETSNALSYLTTKSVDPIVVAQEFCFSILQLSKGG